MANICDTTYYLQGEGVGRVKRILTDIPLDYPMEDVLTKLAGKQIDCDGFINYIYEEEGGGLYISLQTKWDRDCTIEETLWELFPEMNIYWDVEEFGCEVFYTNDSSLEIFGNKYYLDIDCEGEYYDSEEDVVNAINEHYGKNVCTDIDTALAYIHDDADVSLFVKEVR